MYRSISRTSTQWQSGELAKVQEKDDAIRVVQKRPPRPPLVKNFFLGLMDTELVAYPEAINENEHHSIIQKRKKEYEDFLEGNVFNNPDDLDNIKKLKEFGCFRNYGALMTDSIYRNSESQGKILSYNIFLNQHQQIIKLVDQFGDAAQKLKYMQKLETGGLIGVPCPFEAKSSPCGKKTFAATAKFKDDSDEWIVNGEKSFILMSPAHKDSSLFFVLAMAESVDRKGDFSEELMTLLVDGDSPGVSITSVDETIGYDEKAFNQVTVKFDNVALGKCKMTNEELNIQLIFLFLACVLGNGKGIEVAMELMKLQRLDKGVQALQSVMKPVLKELTNHCINTKSQGVHMKNVDTVKEQLGSLATKCYALESMIYMTAGLMDIYEKQDVELEAAMVQAFAIESMTDFLVRPLYAVGPSSVIKAGSFEKNLRDAAQVAACGETLDSVKQFITLTGLHHAGELLVDQVKKMRNPLDHPNFIFSRIFKETSIEHPKKKFNLEEYLHPSLEPAANFIEFSILRMNAATEILLGRYGALVTSHTVETALLAEAATLCYASFCAAARASRSYCIGLRNADQEINLAICFAFMVHEKVKKIAKDVDKGEYSTSEHTFKVVGEKLIETKSYHLEHPTAKNF